jgi:predicted  nucleic acid-binding Zn-ribbon protein
VEEIDEVSLDAPSDAQDLESLCERLLRQQPQSQRLLKRLLARSQRVFAPVRDRRCSACNMTIATARIQQAKAGKFINCANCMVFLYHEPV